MTGYTIEYITFVYHIYSKGSCLCPIINGIAYKGRVLFGYKIKDIHDSFHLVPRSYALWTTGLEANVAALGTTALQGKPC